MGNGKFGSGGGRGSDGGAQEQIGLGRACVGCACGACACGVEGKGESAIGFADLHLSDEDGGMVAA